MQSEARCAHIIRAVLFAGGVLLIELGCARPAPPIRSVIVEVDELATRLGGCSRKARPVLLDVRDAAAYDAGHVDGAVRVDPLAWKHDSLAAATGLPNDVIWRRRIGALDISGVDPVIIYDDGRMTEAARVWFILQHFGVSEPAVLNGGYRALAPSIADGTIRITQAPTRPGPVEFRPQRSPDQAMTLVDKERVRRAIQRGEAQVLDVRSVAEFTGKDPRTNPRAGHLPTAINLPHTALLDETGRLKDPAGLTRTLEQAGLQRGKPIITHCESGGRASLAALAAKRAGFGPVWNYYLSFSDWSADASCPVEQP